MKQFHFRIRILLQPWLRSVFMLMLLCNSSFAQNVISSEYFLDTDPGIGNGTPLSVGAIDDSVSFNATVTINGLNPGYHFIYLRTKAGNGKWSLQNAQRFYVKSQIIAAEYFIDADPGVGNGTAIITGSAFDTLAYSLSVSTAGLEPGAHTIYTRTKDNRGQWSLYAYSRFYIKKDIVAAEYFFDNDPGPGNGTALALMPALDSVGFNGTVSTTGLLPGFHELYVRTKSGQGNWSLHLNRQIFIKNSIVAAEYFFDNDPGVGNGYAYTVSPSSDSVNFNAALLLPSLTPGWHYLYFRTRDALGKWSLSHLDSVDVLPFTCIPPSLSLSGTHISCFGNADGTVNLGITGGSSPFSYSWTGPNSFFSNQQNISGLIAGKYYVQVTAFGGCFVKDSIIITQPAQIVSSASNNSPFCSGGNLNVSATTNYDTSGTTTYLWSGPNGFSSTLKNPSITGATNADNGTYKVIVTTGNNCKDSATTNVNIAQIVTYYADADSDGYGNAAVTQSTCTGAPLGYVSNSTDCNDNNNAIHPGATEICNGIDDDCDNQIDEGLSFINYYVDADYDGYGNPAVFQNLCSGSPAGYVTNGTDCNDADSLEHPGQSWYYDNDADHYGTGQSVVQCSRPSNGYTASELIATTGDCNDNNASINPGAQTLAFSSTAGFNSSLCNPLLGSAYTLFQFEVIYTDANNQLPPAFYPRVLLDYEGNGIFNNANDRTIIMTESDVNDQTTSDGKKYIASINSLPTGTNYQTRVIVSQSGCNTEIGPFHYPDVLVQPDLEIFANDISFSAANPPVASPLTVNAIVHNPSDYFANNFVAHLVNQYDSTIVYPDIVVATLAPHATTTLSWNITTPAVPAWCPMQVSIDYTNVISETNELNNSAIRPFINGNFNLPGGIILDVATSPSVAYTTQPYISLVGSAHYYGTPIPLPDSSVAGATVSFTIVETGATYSTYTNSGGNIYFGFPSPGIPGVYHINASATDFTLTGTDATQFTLIVPPPPVVCTLPELSMSMSTTPPPVPYTNTITIVQGNSISGSFTVTNTGTGATTGNTVLGITHSGGTPALNNVTVPPLAPGASFTTNFNNLLFNTPGYYNLCITADANNTEVECNDFNNSYCRGINVLPALPDIYPYSGTNGVTYLCTAGPNIGFTMYNAGGSATGPFNCDVLVKKNGIPLTTLSQSVSNIPSQQFGSISIPYSFPGAGNYSFELICDVPLPDGVVAETNESNNAAVYSLQVLECKPNLIMAGCESFDVQSTHPFYTGPLTLQATIYNNGNAVATGPVNVKFHLSGGADYFTVYNGNLAPGQSAVVTVNAAAVTPATQTLTATADDGNSIDEFNEADNSITNSMCWDFAPVPYCYGGNFWNYNYHINQVIPLSVGVTQSGLYDAGILKIRFLVSGPGISGTVNLGDATLTNVEQVCGCPLSAVLPNSFVFSQLGTYTFTMITDPDNQYAECNEANNSLTVNVTVTNLPDMRILSQHIAPSKLNPQPNEPITMNVSYENLGQSNINDQMKLRVLVDNTPIDSIYPVTGLTTNGTTTYAIPASWASNLVGVHVIRAIIDDDNQVLESNESNNEATRAIVVGEAANLYFQVFASGNQQPVLNDNLAVHARIGNNGDLDVEGDVVFSYVNNYLDTIQIGSIHVAVSNNDSLDIQMPWLVADPSTVLVGKIINASGLEFTYDDNFAHTIIGGLPVITFVSTPDCFGNGSLTAVVTGGEAPYSFEWNGGAHTQTVSGSSGSYTVIVTDLFNQKDTATGIIATGPCCPSCTKAPKKPAITVSGTSASSGTANKFCPGDVITVSVNVPDANACSYVWTAPAGGNIISGQGTISVTIELGSGFNANSAVSVYAQNLCGQTVPASKPVNAGKNIYKPGAITQSGIAKICPGETRVFSVPSISGISVYTWMPPAGTNILSGQGTTSIDLEFTTAFTATGPVQVFTENACGTSVIAKKNATYGTKPPVPSAITGDNIGVCGATNLPYSTAGGGTGYVYNWFFDTPEASVSGGQGSASITADFTSLFTSGALNVTAENGCGISSPRKLNNIKAIPAAPAVPAGPANVCFSQANVTYSIPAVQGAGTYTWTAPAQAVISDGVITSATNTLTTSSHAITISFGTKKGAVKVVANNACGSSGAKSLNVNITNCARTEIAERTDYIQVLPNPVPQESGNKLNVVFFSGKESKYTIKVYDGLGKEVLEQSATAIEGNNQAELNVSNLAAGVYQLMIVLGEGESFPSVNSGQAELRMTMSYKARFVVE